MKSKNKGEVTPEVAIKILKEHGREVTREEAKLIVDFLYKLAEMAIDQYVKP